jgi:phage shock protein PspC (stress-responsive transcriptional regulator)
MVAGVCGGLADYFGLDPTLVRLLWVVTAVPGGIGIFLYFVAWIIVPEEPAFQPERRPVTEGAPGARAEEGEPGPGPTPGPAAPENSDDGRSTRGEGRNLAGLILVGLGVLFLFENLFPWYRMQRFFWPVLLIVIGLWVALRGGRR